MTRASIALLFCTALSATLVAARMSAPHRAWADTSTHAQALLDQGLYDKAEAAARAQVETLGRQEGGNSLEALVATDRLVRSLLLNGKGAESTTRVLAERSLELQEKRLGSVRPDLTWSLLNLGDSCVDTGEYGRAIALLERAVALTTTGNDGSESASLAESLDHLGVALTAAGRYPEALRVLERSMKRKEFLLGGDDVGVARTLEAIGRALQRKGDYSQAGEALRRAAQIQERADALHPAYAGILNALSLQLLFEGNVPEARETALRALAVGERALRPDHPTIAKSLKYLAGAAMDLGDLVEARALLQRALAIAERSLGPRHADMWMYPNDLAGPNRLLGDYPTARRLLTQSLSIAEEKFGPWHDSVATSVHNLALVDASLGDYGKARLEQARAAAIWERLLGRNHPFVAVALMELATVYREQGSPAEALPLVERALSIRQSRLGPNHPDVARTLADLSATLVQLGATQRAQAFATRAVRIAEGLDTPNAPDLAVVFALYADLQAARGNTADAREYYQRALRIRENAFGRQHPAFAEVEIGLAGTLIDLGERQTALQTANDAEATARDHLRLMLRSLPERQALTYAMTRPQGLDLILSLADAAPDAAAIAMDGVIRSRALVLDEMAYRRASALSVTPETSPLRAAIDGIQQQLANLVIRGPGPLSTEQYVTALATLRRERERAELRLAETNASFRTERSRANMGLDEVIAALPPDSALVSFFRYKHQRQNNLSNAGALPRRPRKTSTSYIALVLRAGRPAVAISLGSAAEIDRLVSKWRDDVALEAQPATSSPEAVRPSSRLSGHALRARVWDPVSGHLPGASRIFLVPDGALALIPFVALPVGRADYLLEKAPTIHYLSAERDLVGFSGSRAAPANGLLALGGPAFNARTISDRSAGLVGGDSNATTRQGNVTRSRGSACQSFAAMTFGPLAGTLQEVREVAGSWNSQQSMTNGTASVVVGAQATERAFKQRASGYSVLHLATHGFFLEDSCSSAPGDTRAVGGLVKTGAPARTQLVENPLLLSGLALAGANRRRPARAGEEDGILTAEEVAALDLGGVEWAVLSACNTGIGRVSAGEGVFGLRRAFQIAGARTVVMSLWAVDDQATRAWMRVLYDGRFRDQLTTADAVREASLAILRDRRARRQSTKPFYWAAFVAVGDWR